MYVKLAIAELFFSPYVKIDAKWDGLDCRWVHSESFVNKYILFQVVFWSKVTIYLTYTG